MFSKRFDPGLALLFCLNVHNHMDAMVRPSENGESWRTGPGWRSGLPKTMADGGQDQDGASRGSDMKVGGKLPHLVCGHHWKQLHLSVSCVSTSCSGG